jgi:REP element-mobilizing transposase RayT
LTTKTVKPQNIDNMTERKTRKPLRLKDYDYRQSGYYFVTFCVKNKEQLLWEAPPVKAVNHCIQKLSLIGRIAEEEIQHISKVYPGVFVDKYVVMPNHIHMIVVVQKNDAASQSPTLSQVIQQTKGQITKRVGFSFWQRSFYDHIIRNQEDYEKIWQYIDSNPEKWQEDCYYILPKLPSKF